MNADPTEPLNDTIRWWWVRHAPVDTVGFCGWSDPSVDLSDSHAVGRLRASLPEDAALWSSDLKRAWQTADALARRTWARLPREDRLREQNFGTWEGARYDELPAREAEAYWRDPANRSAPDGESFADVCRRVAEAVSDLSRVGDLSADVVAVTHAGVVRAALAQALGLTPLQALGFEIAPFSLTRIDYIRSLDAWRICAVNITV